jgi:WD40 repeat protein
MLASAGCAEKIQDPVIDAYECARGEIILWGVGTTGATAVRSIEIAGPIYSLAFSPDGKILASAACEEQKQDTDIEYYACVQGEIIFWDLGTGKALGQPITETSGKVASIAFSPNETTLAAANWDWKIILWDVATHQPIGQPLTGHTGSLHMVVFSPDGKMLASTAADESAMLWDVATHTAIGKPLRGYTAASSLTSVAFSPDGKMIASSNWDQTILLWDVETQKLISQPLRGHSDRVNSIAFSPDGKWLATGSEDQTIILWNMDVQSWVNISCQRAGRNFTRDEWAVYFSGQSYPTKQEEATCPQWPLEPEATPTP